MPEFHPPIEEYLKAIYLIADEGLDVTQSKLVDLLHHAAPTVSATVHRLRADGHVEIKGRKISLTTEGYEVAAAVVRKHHLAERLLTDIIGLAWEKAHAEAGRWEHVISDDVEQRLIVLLGNPSTCPHGNRIPGSQVDDESSHLLAEADRGARVRIDRIYESVENEPSVMPWLANHGLFPGGEATVVGHGPEGITSVRIDDERLVSLGPDLAQRIMVSPAGR